MATAATDVCCSSLSILSTSANPVRRSPSRLYSSSSSAKRQDRPPLARNQVFNDTGVDSYLISSSSSVVQSTIEVPKSSSSSKRYVSSFKTLVHSTSGKHNQRMSYANDSVIILKLSRKNASESTSGISQISGNNSNLSMATSTTLPLRQSSSSPPESRSILKIEGHKRRLVTSDSPLTPSTNIEVNAFPNSVHTMAMSATSHPSSNPSLLAYRSTLTPGTTVRQRALAETTTTSLFITTERLKANVPPSMRPARQSSTATMPSTYIPSQQPQRNTSQSTKSRASQDKVTNPKDLFEYPDPFTNCPQDILSRLAQLTKLQLDTIEWEKKRRFTKKKTATNSTAHGKDSP